MAISLPVLNFPASGFTMSMHDRMIGITATLPVEILFAGGVRPVDLNNMFITDSNANHLVSKAEVQGFSHNICSWIKGIYSVVFAKNIKEVIAVTGGDCSNTIALGEVLCHADINVTTFEYPQNKDRDRLIAQMERLQKRFSVTWPETEAVWSRFKQIRNKLKRLDRLTWETHKVTGYENHLFLVQSSDFNSDPGIFEKELDKFLVEAEAREPRKPDIRLGYLGVPPVFTGFYELIDSLGAGVVFNEIQRQFSMPFDCNNIIDQYLTYTYPYDMDGRLKDIKAAVKERNIDGLVHYTQTFCYRQIYDIIIREEMDIPVLTLEGDRPGPVDSRITLRIETFIEMLRQRKYGDIF